MAIVLVVIGATAPPGVLSEAAQQATQDALRERTAIGKSFLEPLEEALKRAEERNHPGRFQVIFWNIAKNPDFEIQQENLVLIKRSSSPLPPRSSPLTLFGKNADGSEKRVKLLPLGDIQLVVKRTLGQASLLFLKLGKLLESHGIRILNGCDFIERSSSKLAQYRASSDKSIFPETLCVDVQFLESLVGQQSTTDEKIQALVAALPASLVFPLLLKPAQGFRGKGIVLIEDLASLKIYLTEKLGSLLAFEGFVLQNFISTHPDPERAVYYRINLVGKKPQSAVKFEYSWRRAAFDHMNIKELFDSGEKTDYPVSLNSFNPAELNKILEGSGLSEDAFLGIDVIVNPETGRVYFLEFNTTPSIHSIVELGKEFLASPKVITEDERQAAQACIDFPQAIADYCVKYALSDIPEAQPAALCPS